MVDTTVGAAAADWVCIDTPTPLSAKSTNKTGIQKGIFLILHCLLSFKNGGFVHLIIGLIWLGLAWLGLACKDNAICFPLKIYIKYLKFFLCALCVSAVNNYPTLIKNQLYLSSLFSLKGLNLAFTKLTINV